MPTDRQLNRMLEQAKARFALDVGHALAEIGEFATAVGNSLVDVSREEALDALGRKAREVFDRLR